MKTVKVAIIGGGMGGLTTAYSLARRRVPGVTFDVTVFEARSFLGGKGANLRSRDGELRIEEHGLHVWLGFYRNAFRVMADVYEDLGRDITEGFEGAGTVGFGDRGLDSLRTRPPKRDGVPWDRVDVPMLSPRNLIALAIDYVLHLARGDDDLGPLFSREADVRAVSSSADPLEAGLHDLFEAEAHARHVLSARADDRLSLDPLRLIQSLIEGARGVLDGLGKSRPILLALDLLAAITRAVFDNGLTGENADWKSLDNQDIDDLLARYGASEAARASPIARGYLDLVFSRPKAEGGAGMAAGTGLRGLLSMIAAYRGHPVYLMKGGMGEVVFAPLYRVLTNAGVKFEWAEVSDLALSDDGKRVVSFAARKNQELDGQDKLATAQIGDRRVEYWRADPDFSPSFGPKVTHTDFDEVVLAVPVPAQAELAKDIAEKHPRYAAMLAAVRHTATRSVQAWWDDGIERVAPWGSDAILCSTTPPYVAWADMTHILPYENGPAQRKGLTYHCADLLDTDDTSEDTAFEAWCAQVGIQTPPARVYLRRNTEGSERYVLSVAGTTAMRLEPEWSGVDNLWLAGDWTLTSLPAGCIEAATESGLKAAMAVRAKHQDIGPSEPEPKPAAPLPRPKMGIPPGPYLIDGVKLQGLVLDADRRRLQALVDEARPRRGGAMTVPFGKLLVSFLDVAAMGSDDPRYRALGTTSERELAFWIPVLVKGTLAFYAPWLWVDDPLAIALGREVYGYNKLPARFPVVRWSDSGELEALRVETLQPDEHGQLVYRPLVDVNHSGRSRRRIVGELGALMKPLSNLSPPPWLLFREHRQPGPPWGATREALLLRPRAATQVVAPKLSGSRYELTFAPSKVYDLPADLGLETPTKNLVAFTQTLSFVLGAAEVVAVDLG